MFPYFPGQTQVPIETGQ